MKTLETNIIIDAAPQTVWSIMDDLEKYPDWNKLVPNLSGLTTVGEVVKGKLVHPNTPEIPLSPTLTRIIGGRELRWLTIVPGNNGFSAEHYFVLIPTFDGGTSLVHNEDFDGPAVALIWPGIDTNGRLAYNQMNADLKIRAEALAKAKVVLHPAVKSNSLAKTSAVKSTLTCYCPTEKVEVVSEGRLYHNHLCGCSKCWKPKGALFAQTAVAAADLVQVSAQGTKLVCVDPGAAIKRFACNKCGVHMLGRVEDQDHHFYGLVFLHPELGNESAPKLEFAGFVSSIIETGTSPSLMQAIRHQLNAFEIPAYDAFSSEIMDIISWHKVKLKRHANKPDHTA